MTPERHQLLRQIVLEACARPPEARAVFLDQACGDETDLRARAEALLADLSDAATVTSSFGRPRGAGSRPAADGRLAAGTLVDGKYRVEELLGRGGMGEVYRATHLQIERGVALKFVRAEFLLDGRAVERLRREARAVARLKHPHIVTLHDFVMTGAAGAYLVMELLAGRSLRAELRQRPRVPAREAVELTRQVCSALAAAHRARVIHRDLKPDNIFLERAPDGSPVAKVLDFGIAKLREVAGSDDHSLTAEGVVPGTPPYMSPEQCRGERLDGRSDLYALGCVLYELLTGRPPFAGEGAAAVIRKHIAEAPARPSAHAPEVPGWLEAVVLRALAKRPDERFRNAEEFARAIAEGAVVTASTAALGGPAGERAPTPGVGEGPGGASAGVVGMFAERPPAPPTNLPQPLTSFVGRERELTGLARLLERERLLTLTGVGGVGKTRLALELARQALAGCPDGVWLVELAALGEPSLVPQAVGHALGVHEAPGRKPELALAEWLGSKRMLLVLDNCEHLVEPCARLADALLRACPGLRVLATSREVLGLAGEATRSVAPLSVPAGAVAGVRPEHVAGSEAVRLFVERVRSSKPGFALILLC